MTYILQVEFKEPIGTQEYEFKSRVDRAKFSESIKESSMYLQHDTWEE